MNYQETLDYLYSRLPMFSKIGADAYKKDLGNTIALCSALDDPQKKFKSIHVAGTNGKGSVSHMLAAIFQSAGYRTGLYTSPHLRDFRERIRINGEMISEIAVMDLTERLIPLIEKIDPSFFEATVAMAFQYFTEEKVDIAIIETGLGGRLDSTNIITPEISVITNIGHDHMNILGDTIQKIASEKAGIIKASVPAVIGETQDIIKQIFIDKAKNENAPLFFADEKRKLMNWSWHKHLLKIEYSKEGHTDHEKWECGLTGIYQVKNVVTVLETCEQLQQRGWRINEKDIKTGLKNVKKLTGLHGRWEMIHQSPAVIIDVAHNAEGVDQLVQQIELTPHRLLHIIFGMVKDKDAEEILRLFPKTANYYFTKAQIPRALPESELAEKANKAGLQGTVYPDVNTALSTAIRHAHPDDLIIVCGSVFLVGEINMSILPAAAMHT